MMTNFDIFDEFDAAIQKVDREILNLKLESKKNERELLSYSRRRISRAQSFSTTSPDSGFSDDIDKQHSSSQSFVVTDKHRKYARRKRTMRKIRSISTRSKWSKEEPISEEKQELMNIEEEICVFKIKKLLSSAPPGISDDPCWLRLISAFPLQRNLVQGLVLPSDFAQVKSLKPPADLHDAVYRKDMNTWHVLPGLADFSSTKTDPTDCSVLDLSFCESYCDTSDDCDSIKSLPSIGSGKTPSPIKKGLKKLISGRRRRGTSYFGRDQDVRSKSEGDTLSASKKKLQKPLSQKPRMVISDPEIVNLPENISKMRLKSITET
ncbi:Oidioi.mRNA.OKI2018_I69.chr1.g2636.t1.cds [Oikopleura dioica]|uniref:Oidioi.mRNA.OKI2018_I69.chr1.g2636.t1.cds n=1 Tax=Oikopleura dioica TaxID=34765 RepID=A0ABN7SVY1_OIKDI|nr:Oidioi.mRNA.OKI2018_I69.chr1.g2636.t1.cds [Oikopleura dioica]